MQRILVPCDFSNPGINAFKFALDLASQSKGKVFLLNVIHLPVIHDSLLMPVITFEQDFIIDLKKKISSEFSGIIASHNSKAVQVESRVEFGFIDQTINQFAEKHLIDIIIMGSHGVSGLREYVVGSTAEKVVRNSPIPVLVMKDYFEGEIRNIVFPNTLETENQNGLVKKIKELQDFFKATVHIVYVNTPTNFSSDIHTLSRLKHFVKRFLFKDYTINIYNHTNEEEGILQFTNSINGDLIAMGTHGRKGIAHMISGSLAEDVVNHTELPIWTYTLK